MELIWIALAIVFVFFVYRFFGSYKKSREIREISLGLSSSGQRPSLENLLSNSSEMWKKRLIKLVNSNADLRKVLIRNGAKDEDVLTVFRLLTATGAGWEAGHFVPVSALSFPYTLDYVLKKTNNGSESSWDVAIECVHTLSEYFRQRKVGPIS
jgi:hypothetical protein